MFEFCVENRKGFGSLTQNCQQHLRPHLFFGPLKEFEPFSTTLQDHETLLQDTNRLIWIPQLHFMLEMLLQTDWMKNQHNLVKRQGRLF